MRNVGVIVLLLAMLWPAGLMSGATAERVYASREEVPARYKWDMTLYYPGWAAWEADLARVEELYTEMASYKGRLAEGPETLYRVLQISDTAGQLGIKVWGYVSQSLDLDTRDNSVQARFGQLSDVYSRIRANLAWLSPEILTIPEETMGEWIDSLPVLEPYRFNLLDTYRTAEYTLDEAGERLLSLHGKVRSAPGEIFSAITNADGDRPEVELLDGTTVTVTPGLYGKALNSYREAADRRAVQEAWMEQFQARRNTFASIYTGVMQQGWSLAQSRGYGSTLEMRLNGNQIPEEVVTSLIATARGGAGELQRLHRLRREFMGLDRYGWSDMHVPLVEHDRDYDYAEIVPVILDSVALLGEEYHGKLSQQFADGLIDVFETPGKRSGAYNAGRYGVGSFVLLNYQGTLDDVFTVAHEMGHSMHSRLAQDYQPYATHRYTIFVAEVASVFNEKLLLREFLKSVEDPAERIAFLESQIDKIEGTFFLQTMMADFEMQAHRMLESGEGVTADKLTALWKRVVSAYFGDLIPEDDPYMYSWARIPHLYNSPFYVYQYATCYASASSFMKQLEEGDSSVVDRYLELLKSGGNDYPMNQLRKAGIDLTDTTVMEAVIEEFGRLVGLLESEYTRYLDARKQDS